MKPLNLDNHAHLSVELYVLGNELSVEVDRRILAEIQYKLNTWFNFGRRHHSDIHLTEPYKQLF